MALVLLYMLYIAPNSNASPTSLLMRCLPPVFLSAALSLLPAACCLLRTYCLMSSVFCSGHPGLLRAGRV
jgi:hypothetical protein